MGIDRSLSMNQANWAGNSTNSTKQIAPQTQGDSTEELVDVLVRVSHRQEIDLDLVEVAQSNEHCQKPKQELPFVLLRGVVQLQLENRR